MGDTGIATPPRHARKRGRPGYGLATRAAAMIGAETGNQQQAAGIAGVSVRVLRYWLAKFRAWGDSELEPFLASEKRVFGAAWVICGQAGQLLAMQAAEAGKARDYQSAMVGAGIAWDKVQALGQPKTVQQQEPDTLLLDGYAQPVADEAPSADKANDTE